MIKLLLIYILSTNLKVFNHVPVLLKEVLYYVNKFKPNNVLDCTFGLGGHSKKILEHNINYLTAIDRDPQVLKWVTDLKINFPNKISFINKKFSDAIEELNNLITEESKTFNLVLCDFGLSSMQIDDVDRGFSYLYNGPLSMNMSPEAIDRCDYLVNKCDIQELAQTIHKYGEEKLYYKIAKNIINNRPITSTKKLSDIIGDSVINKSLKIKSMARVFQAIRIFTNNELEEINILLKNIDKFTAPKCIFLFIYFHSLEGKEVFKFLNKYKKNAEYEYKIHTVSEEEVKYNYRSRSAKMLAIYPKNL